MSVITKWDDNHHHTIIFEFEGDWTWHECREAMQYAQFLLEDAERAVSYIYDLTRNRLPQRAYLGIMQKLFTAEFLTIPPKKIVVLEKGHFVETLKTMLETTLANSDFSTVYFTDTLARARAIISAP
jgi:hypothetical protein